MVLAYGASHPAQLGNNDETCSVTKPSHAARDLIFPQWFPPSTVIEIPANGRAQAFF
jgi:hypothetical protein